MTANKVMWHQSNMTVYDRKVIWQYKYIGEQNLTTLILGYKKFIGTQYTLE